MRQRQPRQRDEKYLAFLRTLPCVICGDNLSTEAAHIRFSDAKLGKFNPGVGMKPDDKFCIPLCGDHHRDQHKWGDERAFWKYIGIDPLDVARKLYAASGDFDEGLRIVMKAGEPVNIMSAG